jgi:hypothetical protein
MSNTEATDGKVPMPASGENSPKLRSDGVSDVGTHGRTAGGESGGGGYENPHTGKEARGESGDFDGGQSEQAYHGPEPLNGEKVPEENSGPIDKGRGGSG